MEDEKAWVYIGKGDFIDGVPARDLTAADLVRLDDYQQAAVERSPLYRRAPRAKVEEPAEKVGEEKAAEQPAAAKSAADEKAAAKQEKGKE